MQAKKRKPVSLTPKKTPPPPRVAAHERNLFNALMNSSPDPIYFKDTHSRFMHINHAQAQTLGVADPRAAIGKTDFDFFTPEHAQAAFADEQQIIATGTPLVGKLEQIRRADGAWRWVSATKVPLRDERDQIVGTFGISRDVTAQKELEDELQRVKDYLETLIASANDII